MNILFVFEKINEILQSQKMTTVVRKRVINI